jgi:hypothetical protein
MGRLPTPGRPVVREQINQIRATRTEPRALDPTTRTERVGARLSTATFA